MSGFQFVLEGGTGQQRQWFNDALAAMSWPQDRGAPENFVVMVQWVAEPSCAGHRDYMCTTTTSSSALLEIRSNADDQEQYPRHANIKQFYMEAVMHEIGHVFTELWWTSDDDRTALAGMFRQIGAWENKRGQLADWNPTDKPWEERIVEAVSELFKILYMPDQFRLYDNRSNWDFDSDRLADFMEMVEAIICVETGGEGHLPPEIWESVVCSRTRMDPPGKWENQRYDDPFIPGPG
jgi:hypothetical protein